MIFDSSLEDREILRFDDLMSARSPFDFQSLIEYHLDQLGDDWLFSLFPLACSITRNKMEELE